MGTSPPARKGILLLGVVLGLAIFAAGLALARTYLPEWREMRPLPRQVFRARFAETAARAGFVLDSGEPRVRLVTRSVLDYEPFRGMGDVGTKWLLATHTGIRVEVSQDVHHPGIRAEGRLMVDFSVDCRPQALIWTPRDFASVFNRHDPESDLRFANGVAPVLLNPGESLGPSRVDSFSTSPRLMIPIVGSSPEQHLMVLISAIGGSVGRRAGAVSEESLSTVETMLNRSIGHFAWRLFALLGALALFVGLAVK